MIDLGNTRVLIVVFAMPGCGACDEFIPELLSKIKKHGEPFHVVSKNSKITPGEIPVMLYDAAAEDSELQAFADGLGITATPTTCLMTRNFGTVKIEGAVESAEIDQLLRDALTANR